MRLLRSSRFWLVVFAGLILFSTISMFFMRSSSGGSVAIITRNNEEIYRIDLSEVKSPYSIRVDNPEGGYNIIYVEKGKISDSVKPIVCLPNRVMVLIENEKAAEAPDTLAG